jgi:hypothetical protein
MKRYKREYQMYDVAIDAALVMSIASAKTAAGNSVFPKSTQVRKANAQSVKT